MAVLTLAAFHLMFVVAADASKEVQQLRSSVEKLNALKQLLNAEQLLATLIADDIIENEIQHWGHVGSEVITARRRSAGDVRLTSREIQQLIDAHNSRRRSVGATNMELMKWNAKLASLAQQWSERCVDEYGNVPLDSHDVEFGVLGQNNWIGDQVDIPAVVDDWFSEIHDYDHARNRCSSGKSCSDYTQLVWSSTTDVGCGVSRCASLAGLTNAVFVVCYYGPPGNVIGQKPFLAGRVACSQCDRGQFFCNNGLCDGSCTSPDANCVCKATCQNCGLETADCRCLCREGSMGVDCSALCSDNDPRCGRGWSKHLCRQPFQFVLDSCPKMCGLCTSASPCGDYE